MALEFAHGAIQWLSTDAVGTDYTVSGLSFQPKAIRFYYCGIQSATDAASEAVHGYRGVGFADGTNQRGVSSGSLDGVGNMSCSNFTITTGVAITHSGGTQTGKLSLQSIESDGFVLNNDDAPPQSITVFYEAWGGSDITNVTVGTITSPTADGDTTHTATGFTSTDDDTQVVMAALSKAEAVDTGLDADGGFSAGFATGTSTEQVTVVGNQDDGSANSDTDGYCQSGTLLALVVEAGGTTLYTEGAVSAFGTDQFTITWDVRTATAKVGAYMAIKGGLWKAGELTIDGETEGATATVSSLTFAPIGVSLIGRSSNENTADTPSQEDRMSFGSGSSTSSRRSMGYWDEHGTGNGEIDLRIEYDQVLSYPSLAGGLLGAIDINAMNSDGFQLIVDTVNSTGANAEWIGYLTFGSSSGGVQSGAIVAQGAESVNTLTGASTATSQVTSTAESVATLAGASTSTADIASTAESVNTLAGASLAVADISATAEATATLTGESTATADISMTAESVTTLDGASTAEAPISMIAEAAMVMEGLSIGGVQAGDISMVAESVVTLTGESTASSPIISSAEATGTLEGASTAEAPISAAAESTVTLEGSSQAAAAITASGEAIATLTGEEVAGSFASTALSFVAEATMDMAGESTAAGDITMTSEALLRMVGVEVGVEAYRPAWWHGTSRAKLKNPWGKKKRKKIECQIDDEEIFELARIAIMSIYKNRGATGVLARTSSSSRMGMPVCPSVH